MYNTGFDQHRRSKKTYSSSRWEKSFYGGYYSLIMDHPEVSINNKINIDVKELSGLWTWTAEKLIRIFLLHANELGITEQLTIGAKLTTRSKWGIESEVLLVTRERITSVLYSIISNKREYSNLYEHYKNLILTCEISIPLPPKKKDPPSRSLSSPTKSQPGEPDPEEGDEEVSMGLKKSDEEGDEGGRGGAGEGEEENDSDGEGEDDGFRGTERGTTPLENGPGNRKAEIKRSISDLAAFLGDVQKREIVNHFINLDAKNTRWIHPGDKEKCRFTDEEYLYAGRLIKMLDISFDPTNARINSLRTGRLDPRKLAEVLPGNTNVYYKMEENQSTKPFSVVILQDESGSMLEHGKIEYSRSMLKTLYLAFSEILPPEKLFIYGHSGSGIPEIYIYQDKYNPKFEERFYSMGAKDSNYDGPAIEAIYTKARAMTDDNIIFITLSDGQPCGHGYGGNSVELAMQKILEKCRRDGFVTIGLGILHFNNPLLYNYSAVVKSLGEEMIKKTSFIINKVVKTEFQ